MKPVVHLFAFLLLLNTISFAQLKEDDPEIKAIQLGNDLITNIKNNRNYITVLNQLLSHPEYLKYPDYLDMLAWWYTFVGHFEKGEEIEDKAFPRKKLNEKFNPDEYTVEDAVKVISEQSTKHQVIMVNEEHRMPRHRILTKQLLKPLYNNGYRFLAVEALLSKDSLFYITGSPVLQTGVYTKDPVFADLLREAFQLGYTILPYDLTSLPENYGMLSPMQRTMLREEMQARNIISQVLNKNPDAKILVHGGRGHMAKIYEMQQMGADSMMIGMMAGAFKQFSGINPFTVDQLYHEEHSDTLYESSVFKWMRKQVGISEIKILKEKATGNFLTGRGSGFDARVVPSVTKYINGRPDWLVEMPGRQKIYVDLNKYQPKDSSYHLVQAMYANEDIDIAIPADQYAYRKGSKKVLLLLSSGSYIVRVLNYKGNVLKQWEQKVR